MLCNVLCRILQSRGLDFLISFETIGQYMLLLALHIFLPPLYMFLLALHSELSSNICHISVLDIVLNWKSTMKGQLLLQVCLKV